MKPTPGQSYITRQGDTLAAISAQAYGIPWNSALIANTNGVNYGAAEKIATGTNLIIPFDTNLGKIRQKQLNRGLK